MLTIMMLLTLGGKNIKIVENGTVSSIVRDNGLAKMLPPILPKYSELMFNIASAKRVSLSLFHFYFFVCSFLYDVYIHMI